MTAEPSQNSFRARVVRGEKPPLLADKKGRHASDDSLDARMVSRAETRASNHRNKDRHRLNGETATVVRGSSSQKVELINLSAGGAMIGGLPDVKLWDIVELKLGNGFSVDAAVRWIKGDQVGVEFAHETRVECDPVEHAALLLDVIRRSFDDQVVDLVPEEARSEVEVPRERANDRDERRHPLIWVGEIHYAHDSYAARLRNVSEGGALVDVFTDYPLGAEVMLDLREAGQFFATIVWVGGDQAGLKFQEPFDIACLAKAKPQIAPASWSAPTFLKGKATDEDSPWNENWSRSSLSEMRDDLEGYLKR
jgi:hypothetical protein